jgi:hypothetical protein
LPLVLLVICLLRVVGLFLVSTRHRCAGSEPEYVFHTVLHPHDRLAVGREDVARLERQEAALLKETSDAAGSFTAGLNTRGKSR